MEPEFVLMHLLESDHMMGVEAIPRAWVPERIQPQSSRQRPASPSGVAAKAQTYPSAKSATTHPSPNTRKPSAPVRKTTTASVAQGSWQHHSWGQITQPKVLFVSVQWGTPITGDVFTLFERQVAAMKLSDADAALLEYHWQSADEPPADALCKLEQTLRQQISASQPQALVLFGGFTGKLLLSGAGSIMRMLRGHWFSLPEVAEGAEVVRATWHPSQLGIDAGRRKETWEDLQQIMHLLQLG